MRCTTAEELPQPAMSEKGFHLYHPTPSPSLRARSERLSWLGLVSFMGRKKLAPFFSFFPSPVYTHSLMMNFLQMKYRQYYFVPNRKKAIVSSYPLLRPLPAPIKKPTQVQPQDLRHRTSTTSLSLGANLLRLLSWGGLYYSVTGWCALFFSFSSYPSVSLIL